MFNTSDTFNYIAISNSIKISVGVAYLGEQLISEDIFHVWAYNVHIQNQGEKSIKLLRRDWKIIDCNGIKTEIKGDGVVGEQPIIVPQGNFGYTSGAYLNASSGIMCGFYEFIYNEDGTAFMADIPPFSLDSPYSSTVQN